MTDSPSHRQDIDVGFVTHVGMVRTENQDSFGFYEPESDSELRGKGRFLIVCDGMGGHNGGTIASRTTVECMLDAIADGAGASPHLLLSHSIHAANEAVRDKGQRDPELRNMGTTCVAIAVRGSRVEIAHVGDSRAYVMDDQSCEQITRDHTYLNDLIDIGLLTPEMAKHHPERNIITRCVGMSDDLQIEFNSRVVKGGDTLLLCSDGLYNHVEDDEIHRTVSTMEPQAASQALVDLANKRGGEDNITVAILKVNVINELFDGVEGEGTAGEAGAAAADTRPVFPASHQALEEDDATPRNLTPVFALDGTSAGLDKKPGIRWDMRLLAFIVAIEIVMLIVLQVLISRH